jgi:hypothetical protein
MDNNVLLSNNTLLDEDMSFDKNELVKSLNRMSQQTRRALMYDPKLAQVYYEKVQHLTSTVYMVTNFERQLLVDLDVD